eukprot:gene14788-5894_t
MDVTNEPETQGFKEVKKKSNPVDPSIQCLYSRKVCKRKRLRGFDFCHKHILEDKNSPFQQCSFIIKSTEERCVNPAPKAENKKTFCLIHTRDPKLKKAHDEIMRRNLKRKLDQKKATAEAKRFATQSSSSVSTQNYGAESKNFRDPETDQLSGLEMRETDGIYALEDNGKARYDVAWFGENDSDAESVDSEEEDPLRHAGVWTLEEALRMCRDKMIRKRSLYLEQYKRLHILLKERRRRYLMRMAASSYQADPSNSEDNPSEEKLSLSEERALRLYQHTNGTELLLERQAKEKRSRATPDQRLYKKCTFETAASSSACAVPVPQTFRSTTCNLHADILPRFSSESLTNIINPCPNRSENSEENEEEKDEEASKDNVECPGESEGRKAETDNKNTGLEDNSFNENGEGTVCGFSNDRRDLQTMNKNDKETPMEVDINEGTKDGLEKSGSKDSSAISDKVLKGEQEKNNGTAESKDGRGRDEDFETGVSGKDAKLPKKENLPSDLLVTGDSKTKGETSKESQNLEAGSYSQAPAGCLKEDEEKREIKEEGKSTLDVYSDSPKSKAFDTSQHKE